MLEAINKRMSRRCYIDKPIDSELVEHLKGLMRGYEKESRIKMDFIEDAGSSFNGLKSYGKFKNVRSVIIISGDPKDPIAREEAGYYGEMLILEATNLNLGTCWVASSYDKGDPAFSDIGRDRIICSITIGYTEALKGKDKLIHNMSHRKKKPIEDRFYAEGDIPYWFVEGMRAVTKAPSAKNKEKPFFTYVQKKVKVSVPNDYINDLIDLGIAKLHFELGSNKKFCPGNDATLESE